MTGHGEARLEGDGFEIHVETRSVNNRFLRIVTKISEEVSHLQAALEEQVRSRITRGTVFLTVRLTPTRRADFYSIDADTIRDYHRALTDLAEEFGTGETICVRDLALLPGAIQSDDTLPQKEDFLECAKKAIGTALDLLCAMRAREGTHLANEFSERREGLVKLLGTIRSLANEAVDLYQQRLADRVRQLVASHEISVTPQDLIKEVAVLAERSDISEEISRMDSHLQQFGECLKVSGTIGRKLEFIIQEMFREANTMASKSIHPELSRVVVDFKTELDRMKEQIQNVE